MAYKNKPMDSDLLSKLAEELGEDNPLMAEVEMALGDAEMDLEDDMEPEDDIPDEDFDIEPAIPMAEEGGEETSADFDALMAEDMGDFEDSEDEDDEFDLALPPTPVTGPNAKKKKKSMA